jgi:hypothetical protein
MEKNAEVRDASRILVKTLLDNERHWWHEEIDAILNLRCIIIWDVAFSNRPERLTYPTHCFIFNIAQCYLLRDFHHFKCKVKKGKVKLSLCLTI